MKIIKLFMILILAAFGACVEAKTLNFVLVTDIHYSVVTSDTKDNAKRDAAKVLCCFVERMKEQNPDFVVFLGDNVDKSKPEQIKAFMNDIHSIKSPYYLVVGNHDSYKYSGMGREDYAKLISSYNPHQRKYSANYVFYPSPDVAALILDSTSSGMPGTHGYFSENTLKWLDKTLAENKNKKVILFQHVPIVEPMKNKESHNILNAKEYREVVDKYDNIIMIASGHYHRFRAEEDEKGIYHVSVPELYNAPYEYLQVQIKYAKKPFQKAKNFKFDGAIKQAL